MTCSPLFFLGALLHTAQPLSTFFGPVQNKVGKEDCDFTHKLEISMKHIMAAHLDQERFYRLLA